MTSVPSTFADVEQAPPVAVFKLRDDYIKDNSPDKISLGVGAYRDENGNPWVLPVVKTIEAAMTTDDTLNHEYLPIAGLPAFTKAATELSLGANSPAILNNRAFGVQALSGTGSLRIAAAFLKKFYHPEAQMIPVYVSDPTWPNHNAIFRDSGFTDRRTYRYWHAEGRKLDYDGMIDDLTNAPEFSIVILHACAHNPTGVDPTHEQWEGIAKVCKERRLFPIFDSAYQGFASGNVDNDAWSIRHFVKQDFELFVCQSFAKNFGLYNERVGNLIIVLKDGKSMAPVKSQIELLVRAMYSNPPNHGARIVATALGNEPYLQVWKKNIVTMSDRIKEMRGLLYDNLTKLGTPGNWEHITSQIGMFSYTGLNPDQCQFLKEKKHIYLMSTGRISMCGLTRDNVKYFAESVHEAVTQCSKL